MPSLGQLIGRGAIESFIKSKARNAWIEHKGFKMYLRKSKRLGPNGELEDYIDLGSIENPARADNIKKLSREEVHKRYPTGRGGKGGIGMSTVMLELEQAAKKHGFKGVYVEQVHNEFLPEALQRWGYQPAGTPGETSFRRNVR